LAVIFWLALLGLGMGIFQPKNRSSDDENRISW